MKTDFKIWDIKFVKWEGIGRAKEKRRLPEEGVERGVSCRVNLLKEFSVRPEKNEISPETERMGLCLYGTDYLPRQSAFDAFAVGQSDTCGGHRHVAPEILTEVRHGFLDHIGGDDVDANAARQFNGGP